MDKVLEITTYTFTYLKLEIFWNDEEILVFKVYLKANQNMKYINKSCIQMNTTFKATPIVIFNRLAKVTLRTEETFELFGTRNTQDTLIL